MEKSYVVTETLLNATLNYLAKQPYLSVFQLIQPLQTLPEFTQATVSTTETAPLKAVTNEA